jgi:hypothetical protein
MPGFRGESWLEKRITTMNYLHYEFDAGPDDILEVTLEGKANVRLLDDENYEKYKSGQRHTYVQGGYATVSPVGFRPPYQGHWHVVIDLGGYPGRVRAAVKQVAEPQTAE